LRRQLLPALRELMLQKLRLRPRHKFFFSAPVRQKPGQQGASQKGDYPIDYFRHAMLFLPISVFSLKSKREQFDYL
jgi:hypothetical protein